MKSKLSSNACRRAHERYIIESLGSIFLKSGEFPVLIKDISALGMGLVSNFYLSQGEGVTVESGITLDESTLKKKANVVWCRQEGPDFFYSGINFNLKDRGLFFTQKV